MKDNDFPTKPNPGGASAHKKTSLLNQIRNKFKEKPATKEEVEQLKLDAQREVYKTQKTLAKSKRPSRFAIFGESSTQSRSSPRNSIRRREETSSLFGGGDSKMGSWLTDEGSSNSPGFSMFGVEQGKSKKTKSSGIEDLF